MLLSMLPHLLGTVCVLYSLQLARDLYFELRGKDLATCLMAVAAGLAALVLAVALIVTIDYVYPVGGTESEATFFIRVAFLIPASYLAVFIFSSAMGKLIGGSYPAGAVSGIAFLGLTFMVLFPVLIMWHAALFPQTAG